MNKPYTVSMIGRGRGQPQPRHARFTEMSDEALADAIITAVDILKRRNRVDLAKVTLAGEIDDLKLESLCRSEDGAEVALRLVEQGRLTPGTEGTA